MSMTRLRTEDGGDVEAKAGGLSALLVSQILPKYAELTRRGLVWIGGTDSAGVAPGTALGATAGFALENPKGSQVVLVLLRLTAGYISGTLGAGTIFHCVDGGAPEATPIATSTAITAYSALLRSSRGGPVGRLHDGATLLNTPTILRPFCSLSALLASTAPAPYQIKEDIDGEIMLPPGSVWALEAVAAAGSTPLVAYGLSWAEIPLKRMGLS